MTHTCPNCGTEFDDVIDIAIESVAVAAVEPPAPEEQDNCGKPTAIGVP